MVQNFELIWARYEVKNPHEFYLLLYLGQSNGKTLAFVADKILDHEIAIIRANLNVLRQLNIGDAMQWFKTNMTSIFNNNRDTYRTFDSNKLFVVKNLGLKGLEQKLKQPTSTESIK